MLKKGDDDSKPWLHWRRRKKCIKHGQSSLAWGHHPLQCKEHACGKQQGVAYFLFCFPTKKPNTELAQFGCWFISNEIPIPWSYLCSHLSNCWTLHYRKSPVQVFSNCEMLHSLHRLLGLLLDSVLSLGEEGREEAICLSRFLWNCC